MKFLMPEGFGFRVSGAGFSGCVGASFGCKHICTLMQTKLTLLVVPPMLASLLTWSVEDEQA